MCNYRIMVMQYIVIAMLARLVGSGVTGGDKGIPVAILVAGSDAGSCCIGSRMVVGTGARSYSRMVGGCVMLVVVTH